DLEVAGRMLRAQTPVPADLPVEARYTDLLRWFLSESFSALRAELGIALQVDERGEPGTAGCPVTAVAR
ncbi:MAG: hypothetical protein KKI08_03080, partial [Armatimonadetes bacterium]|nr:hypothetical protein [Armatimonadota bacterium]